MNASTLAGQPGPQPAASATPAQSTQAEDQLYAKVTRRLITFLFIGYVFAFIDRTNVGFAKLGMQADLGFSEAVFGFGAGIFFVSYFLLEVPSNMMLARFGARRWIARILITWGLLSVATLMVKTPTQFYVVRFLLGAAEAGFFPGVMLYLTQWYPAQRRGRVITLFMAAIPVGSILGGIVSGWILSHFASNSLLAGWQWLFLLEGAPAVIMGIMALWYLDDSIAQARWLSDAEKQVLQSHVAADQQQTVTHNVGQAMRSPLVWRCRCGWYRIHQCIRADGRLSGPHGLRQAVCHDRQPRGWPLSAVWRHRTGQPERAADFAPPGGSLGHSNAPLFHASRGP